MLYSVTFDLNFQGQSFDTLIYGENVRASTQMHYEDLAVTLTSIFKFSIFKC